MPAATCPYAGAGSPPDAVCELVRKDVIATLESVTTENGWRKTLDVHAANRIEGEPPIADGLTIVYPDDPQPKDGEDQQSTDWEQTFVVKTYLTKGENDSTPDDQLLFNIAGDVLSALTQTETMQRGGLATMTEPAGIMSAEVSLEQGSGLVIFVAVKVTYAHAFGDATTRAYQ